MRGAERHGHDQQYDEKASRPLSRATPPEARGGDAKREIGGLVRQKRTAEAPGHRQAASVESGEDRQRDKGQGQAHKRAVTAIEPAREDGDHGIELPFGGEAPGRAEQGEGRIGQHRMRQRAMHEEKMGQDFEDGMARRAGRPDGPRRGVRRNPVHGGVGGAGGEHQQRRTGQHDEIDRQQPPRPRRQKPPPIPAEPREGLHDHQPREGKEQIDRGKAVADERLRETHGKWRQWQERHQVARRHIEREQTAQTVEPDQSAHATVCHVFVLRHHGADDITTSDCIEQENYSRGRPSNA